MILTGPAAHEPGKHALTSVKAVLMAALAGNAAFSPWGGVAVLDDHTTAQEYTTSKRPFVFLEIGDARQDDTVNFSRYVDGPDGKPLRRHGARWLIEVVAEVVTVGACSPAEEPLKDALISAIGSSYKTLRDAGFEGAAIRAGAGRDQKEGRINPHAITGAIHVLF